MKKLRYSALSFFLLLGLIVSSIGVTWCHYQVIKDFPLTYFVKTNGEFILEYENEEWSFDPSTQIYSNEFTISNQNEFNNSLYLTFISSEKADYTMVLIEPSGREVRYDSILVQDESLNYHYMFIDSEGKQVKLEVEGNKKSKLNIRLEAKHISTSFISEIILEDAAFETKENGQMIPANYKELELESNYLSIYQNVNVYLDKNTIELTFTSNMKVESKVTTNDSKVTLNAVEEGKTNKYKSYDLTLEPNETKTLTLDVTSRSSDIITVTWDVYDGKEVVKTLSANFMIKQESVPGSLIPIIEMNYIDGVNTFNQYEPIQFMIKSDITATVQIGPIYPANTYYSYDDGLTWYVITKEDVLEIPLIFGQNTKVMIDLSKSDIEWDDVTSDVTCEYYQEDIVESLEFEMEFIEIDPFEVRNINMGILDEDGCSFTVNSEDVIITVEEYVEGVYVPLDEDIFTIENNGALTYTITKNEENIPKGIYRVKLQQFYNETLIKEEELYFFTIEEVNA